MSLLQRIPRRRSWKQALHILLYCVGGLCYLYVFFLYQPDRTRQRLDAWTASVEQRQQSEETNRILQQQDLQQSTEVSDHFDTQDAEQQPLHHKRSLLSTMVDWLLFWMAFSFVFRMYMRHCIYPRLARARAHRLQQDLRGRRQRFRQWVSRLNRQRQANGQRPMSLESLSLVLRDRDLSDGQDYDGLLQFDEEAGPAMEALLNSVGATQEEIDRCPLRTLQSDDDLLMTRRRPEQNENDADHGATATINEPQACPICLEAFVLNDSVRTIPCFHAFHKNCIDPWLAQRALCPVCKYNAVG